MEAKEQLSYHDDRSIERLLRMTRKYGRVGLATIDGCTCAGIICFRVGSHILMPVLAHNPRYDNFRLGKLCCYLSICDSIEQGAREYHFGWTRFEYKFRMLGQLKPLYRVELYRSRLHIFFDGRHVLTRAVAAGTRALKLRVERAHLENGAANRWINACAKALSALKWALLAGARMLSRSRRLPRDRAR
jgi:hypothetical protein